MKLHVTHTDSCVAARFSMSWRKRMTWRWMSLCNTDWASVLVEQQAMGFLKLSGSDLTLPWATEWCHWQEMPLMPSGTKSCVCSHLAKPTTMCTKKYFYSQSWIIIL